MKKFKRGYKALKDNGRYDRFQVVLQGACHCGVRHVVAVDGLGWDCLVRVKACLSIVRDVNVSFREAAEYGFLAALEKLKVEAEQKLKVL